MIIKILSLKIKDIRDFDNLHLHFSSNDKCHHITLIQMPNGTGKTTTINILRHLFSGSKFDSQEVMELKPKLFEATRGSAELALMIENERYTVKVEFNYDMGSHKYFTTSPKHKGQTEGHNLPLFYIMNDETTKLFIFDGELAKDLLSQEKVTAENALSQLYNLDILKPVMLEEISNRLAEKERAYTTSKAQGIQRHRNELIKLQDYRRDLNAELEENTKKIKELGIEIEDLQKEHDEIISGNEELREEYQKLVQSNTDYKINKANLTSELKAFIRNPYLLSPDILSRVKRLNDNFDKLKLPKTTSSIFFDEIIECGECICGTKLNEEKIKLININRDRILSDSHSSTINVIKETTNNDIRGDIIINTIKDIFDYDHKIGCNDRKLSEITRLLTKEKMERIDEIKGKIDDKKTEIGELKEQNDLIQSPDLVEDPELSLPVCNRRIKELMEKVGRAEEFLRYKLKTDLLTFLINEIFETSMESLKKEIIDNTNNKLEKITAGDVQIEDINKCLRISGKSGVSEGQSLAVAYSFLSSLFENSDYDIPFVVDSPCVSLDQEIRREVSNTIPTLFSQLIMFIISTEREGFLKGIESFGDVLYYTVNKNKKGSNLIEVRTEKEFFNNFQSEVV